MKIKIKKFKPGARRPTVLATVDFLKDFDSAWCFSFLFKLLSIGLLFCFVK